MIAKPQFWILYFCLFVAMGVVFLGCGIYDVKRPKVVIETDGKILFVNSKEGWKQIEIADVTDVKKVRTVSGRTVLRRGRITIFTKTENIVVYNVANVEGVCLKLLKLCALI